MGNSSTITYSPPDDLDDVAAGYRLFATIFQSLLAITGTFGNLLTLIAVFSCKKLRRTHNAYIAHLAFVDLLISGFLVPINIVGIYRNTTEDDSVGCKAIAVISLAALVASILSLFMVAFNRYILICKGMYTYTRMYNKKTVPASIAFIWIIAIAVVTPMLAFGGLGWSKKTHYCFFINYDFTAYIYMSVVLAQAGVVAPAIGTSLSYMMIIKKLRATARKLAPKSVSGVGTEPIMAGNSYSGTSSGINGLSTNEEKSQIPPVDMSSSMADDEDDFEDQEQTEKKISTIKRLPQTNKDKYTSAIGNEQLKRQRAKQRTHNRRVVGLILIFMIFMVCWLPIAVTFTIDYKQQLPGLVYMTLISVAWINSGINVFLYAFTNQTYRHTFNCILKCKFSEINTRL